MSVPQEPDSLEFAGYFGVLRRRWWIVLIWTLLGVLGAGAYIVASPKAYTATTTVNVTPTGVTQSQGGAVAGGRTSSALNLDTETQIVRSSTVAARAARALHSTLTPTALAAHVSVAVPANSSVLQISCQARTAQQAAACANAFGAAYLKNRSATALNTTNAELATVRSQLTSLEKRIARLTIQIQSLPVNSPQRASAQAQLQTAGGQLKAMSNQAASLAAQAAASSGGSIITMAVPPTTSSSPVKKIILPSGLLAGLLIGLVIAFAWDKRDTRVKDAMNLGQFGVPALLALSGKDLRQGPLAPPRSAAGLEFTELARSLTATLGQDEQLMMVAGASRGHSATVTAANLAVALARTRSAVILVCPSGQGTAQLLRLPESRCLDTRGAAELAAGELSLDDVSLQPAGFPGLRVVVLAADLHDLPHAHARQLAAQLRSSAEYAVIQVPESGTGPDSLALAEYCGGALLAIEISVTKREEIEDSIRRLNRLGTFVVGLAALPQLRLPTLARQVPERVSSGSVRLRKAEPATPAAGSGPTWPVPAGANDGQATLSMPAVHVDAADGPSGN